MSPRGSTNAESDALVIFGITGDLAHKMTFHSLYRLEKRDLLEVPVIGAAVENWSLDQLKDRARASIIGSGEKLQQKVFNRFARRLQYVGGAGEPDFYDRLAKTLSPYRNPTFYLEIPPSLFGSTIKGLHAAGPRREGRCREAVRARPQVGRTAGRRPAPVPG